MLASWKGIQLCPCSFQTVLGYSLERLPDLSQPSPSAAASSCQKPQEAPTTDRYINIYNFICRHTSATKLGTLTQRAVLFLLVR